MNLLDYLPGVPDFPKPGVLFRDISPLLASPIAFKEAVAQLHELAQQFDYTHILGIESRGFIFGSALAHHAHKGLALARKPNKLPLASHRESYGLEYGNDSLDKLIRSAGFEVAGAMTLLEIAFLNGHVLLSQNGINHQSLLKS